MNIITKTTKQSSWAELKAAAEAGTIDEIIKSGDLIPFTLKTGEEVAVRTTYDASGKMFFVLENCMKGKRCINCFSTTKGGWAACDIRSYLNGPVFSLLPDEIQAVIVPTTIVQIVDDERVETDDKLFLFSRTQVFGKGAWSRLEPEDTKLECFLSGKDRVKECGDYGAYSWWLRSAYRYYNHFYTVGASGSSGSTGAICSLGVVFGFCLT